MNLRNRATSSSGILAQRHFDQFPNQKLRQGTLDCYLKGNDGGEQAELDQEQQPDGAREEDEDHVM